LSIELPLVFPHSPTIAPGCARDLAEYLVQKNLEIERDRQS